MCEHVHKAKKKIEITYSYPAPFSFSGSALGVYTVSMLVSQDCVSLCSKARDILWDIFAQGKAPSWSKLVQGVVASNR